MPPSPATQPIRFLLDGEIREVTGVPATLTLLDWLREEQRKCGSKEGCAEGDCGACTVVLAELHDDEVRFCAVNSCIRFLPTLDGKALFTVESLRALNGGELHPAQQAMVECHGSQCGFCTPGFVMSLFALRETHAAPDNEQTRFALAGNLCRCTGYRPILAAARRMYEIEGATIDRAALAATLRGIAPDGQKALSGGKRRYTAPGTANELATLLSDSPDATILAGGTDIGLWVTKQYAELDDIVYIGNVSELRRIERTDGHIRIGAAVSLSDAFAVLLDEYPDLHEIARRFASLPICNSGTLCGNVANGSPIGDSMPALIALGARVELRKGERRRELPLEDLYVAYMKKKLEPGEFVEAIAVPLAQRNWHFRAYKNAKRYEQDISSVCAAFAVRLAGTSVLDARVAFGGMAAIPKRAPECEKALLGAAWQPAGIEAAAAALDRDFKPLDDFRASAKYRAQIAQNLLRRFYLETVAGTAPTRVWQHGITP